MALWKWKASLGEERDYSTAKWGAAIQQPWAQWRGGETLEWPGGSRIMVFSWSWHQIYVHKDAFFIQKKNLFTFYLWAAFSRIFFLSASRSCQDKNKEFLTPAVSSLIHYDFFFLQVRGGAMVSTLGVVSDLLSFSSGKENILHGKVHRDIQWPHSANVF